MITYRLVTIGVACLVACTAAQTNYVEDNYEYDAPPPRPAHRAASFRPAPSAPSSPRVAPVAILKQINRHNDDGSYTYGYEGGDGSFKIETKLNTGEVMGKYGYVDDTGKVRVVEYGANRYGFMPVGEGITVAPPTLVDDSTKKGGLRNEYVDDGSYYEEEPLPLPPRPAPRARPQPRPAPRPQPQPVYDEYVPPPPPPPARRPAPSNLGPAPPRAAIPGAVPAFHPAPVYEDRPAPPPPRSLPPPPPPRPQHRFEDLPPRSHGFDALPPSRPQRFDPPPQSLPPPPSRQQHARTSGGILDQLERDYALPQSSAAITHDVTFGSY